MLFVLRDFNMLRKYKCEKKTSNNFPQMHLKPCPKYNTFTVNLIGQKSNK